MKTQWFPFSFLFVLFQLHMATLMRANEEQTHVFLSLISIRPLGIGYQLESFAIIHFVFFFFEFSFSLMALAAGWTVLSVFSATSSSRHQLGATRRDSFITPEFVGCGLGLIWWPPEPLHLPFIYEISYHFTWSGCLPIPERRSPLLRFLLYSLFGVF